MLEATKDMIRAAIDYKRRVAGTFMLVEPKNMRARLSGSDFAVTRKIDGVMAYCVYRDGDVAILGSAGRDLSAVPVARDLAAALKAAKAKDAVIAAELYVPNDNGRPRVFDAPRQHERCPSHPHGARRVGRHQVAATARTSSTPSACRPTAPRASPATRPSRP